jgi:hypothetical protein
MAHTRTLPVDIRKLQSQGDEGVLMLRLMMACNDLTTANQALGMYSKDTREKVDYIRRGATMYFVRLQLSHLHEALKVVSDIRSRPKLLRLVDDCPGGSAECFARLLSFADGGTNEGAFHKYVELVRHKVTFHYDRRKVGAALNDRARRRGDTAHFMTIADDIGRVRFQIADDLVDTLVCHHIWGIAPGSNAGIEADQIANFGFTICKTLVDFSRALIMRYIEKNALFTR